MTAHSAKLWHEQVRIEQRTARAWADNWGHLKAPEHEIDRRLSRVCACACLLWQFMRVAESSLVWAHGRCPRVQTQLLHERRRAPRETTLRLEDFLSSDDDDKDEADAPAPSPGSRALATSPPSKKFKLARSLPTSSASAAADIHEIETDDIDPRETDRDLMQTYRRKEYLQRDLPIRKYAFPQSTAQELGWAWARKNVDNARMRTRAAPLSAAAERAKRNKASFHTLEVFGVAEYGMKRSSLDVGDKAGSGLA